jgi:glycosidase
VGTYQYKAVKTGSWDAIGADSRSNNAATALFTTEVTDQTVYFRLNALSGRVSVFVQPPPPMPRIDNDIWWDGVRHDSRDLLYRTPGGAAPAGTPVLIRLRTYHNDVTSVRLRIYDLNANAQRFIEMVPAAVDVPCYQESLAFTCDFWEAAVLEATPNNLWYRFVVTDGSDTDYYADNTYALDGGLGRMTEEIEDISYALMFYDPAFTAPDWVDGASMYQIFPDRFRSGRANNDPKTGDVRYDDPVLKLDWGILPEGYCRNYADGATNCPWRFDATPPDWSPTKEGPRGRDYYGGDLKGVDQYLDYLQSLGVNVLYFNPLFDSASNHGYDTQDYYAIDPYFGTQKDWENLVKHADQRGMRIILDGVFNHLSSDSMFFDRYHHYPTLGACESLNSPYRSWFYFRDVAVGSGTCVDSQGRENSALYDGWFGFDSIPVINKSLPEVQAYFLTAPDSVSRYWLNEGAAGWRLDVMGDSSFPNGYWETFRSVVKEEDANALIIGELWQKDSTLLRFLRGDRADTTMNYRTRDAILGLLAPQAFDSKGFADSGYSIQPSQFAARLESIREDYPDAAYYSLMNLMGSHDTERVLWTLTPGAETTAEKELDAANLAEGKQRQKIASLIQFTMPGIPTVFYGDEVAMTGDDDPDDRRTFPWLDRGGDPDLSMFLHYKVLNLLRKANDALVNGDFHILLADDASQVVAYGRKTDSRAAVVIINRSDQPQSGAIPVAGYLPEGTFLYKAYAVGSGGPRLLKVVNGEIAGDLGPLSAVVLLTGKVDLKPPAAPEGLIVTGEGDGSVSLAWSGVSGAAGYNLYRSPLSGGGWVKVNSAPLSGLDYTDTGLRNAVKTYYVVTALDGAGNESPFSSEVSGLPRLVIGWANIQRPPSMDHTISAVNRTPDVYGQVWINGVTSQPGVTPSLRAQLGYGPDGSNPAANPDWTWVDAGFNVDAGNNDEFKASLLPEMVGQFDYAYRYTTTAGLDWVYADLDGIGNGYSPAQAGSLVVNPSGDSTPPAAPANLRVISASPAGVDLSWDAVTGDATLYGYEVLRSLSQGGPYELLARVAGSTSYVDTQVAEGGEYFYVVRSLDLSFNRSGYSSEVSAVAQLRTVTLVITVTAPAATPDGMSVYIAGTLDRLDGGLPQWNPSGVVLTNLGSNQWQITLTGKEATQIEYKYTLGSWDFVEKGAACDEIANRTLTLSYGVNGTMNVNDTVQNWRNVSPCGN